MSESRAIIKERMLKAASAIWGYSDQIRESDFDPLLSLLMEVYAAELEKISNEMSLSRERVLQKMVQLMAPDVLTAPMPASAILFAQSMDERQLLEEKEQFLLTQSPDAARTQGPDAAELWFSPAGAFSVTDTRVQYLATGNRLFRYDTPGERETLTPLTTPLEPHVVWLGLSGEPTALKDAQFYFECPDPGAAVFYHHLPGAKWYYGNELLPSTSGFNQPDIYDDELAGWLRAPHNISLNVTRMVRNIHRHKFLHIAENANIHIERNASPPNLTPDFAKELKTEQLFWVRIEFPENIHGSLLANLQCQVNCFPVVNRQLHELTYRLKDWINILPLRCEQGRQFLDLHSVVDQDGTSLLRSTSNTPAAHAPPTEVKILLRKGGVGRFDERDARTVTEHLLQLLRDESAAFSLYNRDFLTAEVKQIQQVINRLSQEMEKSDTTADAVPYLEVTLNGDSTNRHLAVGYWSTQGAAANRVRSGTNLLAYRNGGLRQGNILLLTRPQGGRDRLAPQESIPAYKSAVLSKDRIMSPEDIRLFCLRETGAQATTITVKKGVMVGTGRQAGFVKTIDIHIFLDEREYASLQNAGTLDHWTATLQEGLTRRSMAFMPFRVFFGTGTEQTQSYAIA